jgi:DNA-binding MarR family transcriptional regulator
VPALTGDFLDSYLPYLLRQTDQALSAGFYEALADRGVQRSEWRVIAVLHERGSLSVQDLTTTALSPQPTVTHAVARLEKRGLARRLRGTEDKRQRFVSLTEEGGQLAETLIAEARRLELEVLERCGAGDLTDLLDGLRLLHIKLDGRLAREHV